MNVPLRPNAPAPGASLYPTLLSPLAVGPLTLRNRAIMGAMHTRIETLDRPVERMVAFYAERARGEIGLILTGGIAPNDEGRMEPDAPVLKDAADLAVHRAVVAAAHAHGTPISMQILHAGRYAKLADCVAPSAIKAPINRYVPRALEIAEVRRTVDDFARTAELARQAGYDGVEIMASEGYLLNEFTSPVTNRREDDYGGSFENRVRLPLEIVRAVRRRVGPDFAIIYRISAVDLIRGGMDVGETQRFARLVQEAGADALNTGIGWHEARVPTIAHVVPRAGWLYAVQRVKAAVTIPVIASNRINDPAVAEALLREGKADLVSMARPLLADPDFMHKAREGHPELINTCIACNQGCLDLIFSGQACTCLVNPRAGRELDFPQGRAATCKRIAVIGGGAAGLACAVTAAERGHDVTLFEAAPMLGGQLNLARRIPEKTEFDELLRYFTTRVKREGVRLQLGRAPDADEIRRGGFDHVVVATGVRPRVPAIPGIDNPRVLSYDQAIQDPAKIGARVAIVGAGGIGFDVAECLLGTVGQPPKLDDFAHEYALDLSLGSPGGVAGEPAGVPSRRQIYLLQRKDEPVGRRLAATTGWIRREKLKRAGVVMLQGVSYQRIDDDGLHVLVRGEPRTLAVDHVVICAGQESERGLADVLAAVGGPPVHVIGGAERAAELDALRAIDQGTRLAMTF